MVTCVASKVVWHASIEEIASSCRVNYYMKISCYGDLTLYVLGFKKFDENAIVMMWTVSFHSTAILVSDINILQEGNTCMEKRTLPAKFEIELEIKAK